MFEESRDVPWICHVCDYVSRTGESRACSVCYKTTCSAHLKQVPTFNPETRLYELQPVCVVCSLTN
jgi:hypothetical protein